MLLFSQTAGNLSPSVHNQTENKLEENMVGEELI